MLARLLALSIFLLAASLPAHAGRLVDMDIVNRSSGEVLTPYRQGGQIYVAGNPGDRYAVRLVNRTDQRVMVVLSVDGVNAVSGETAAPNQSGYVLDPWERTEIAGWRKSLREVAQFYFTALPDSYAARTDRPDNVGVIGAAVFREKARPQPVMPYLSQAAPAPRSESRSAEAADSAGSAAAPAAKAMRESERLGTGHGQREYAPTQYTEFERASVSPAEVVSLRYDSRDNLAARGIIPKPRPYWPEPRPFPGTFVPDPRG
jgi:hypothetical protein